jgi:hypothetical protein
MTGQQKTVSPEAQDILDRLREHYRQQGKAAAAANYNRHLKSFFSWAEGQGYSVKTLPPDSVETFLAASGQKETTAYVMRTQIKSALREAHAALGVDFAHLEYQTGKPRAVRQVQKQREKEKRAEKRAAALDGQQPTFLFDPHAHNPVPHYAEEPSMPHDVTQPEPPAPAPATPYPTGASAGGAAGQPIVIQMQQPRPVAPAAVTKGPTATAQSAQRGIVINNHTFTGPYVKISRIADGSEPFVAPGTETFVTTLPASQLVPHGDLGAFLQQFIVPGLRLASTTAQVQFVFHELNDRRQPTGRRDELVVSVPMGGSMFGGQPASAPAPSMPFGGSLHGMPAPAPQFDPATAYLLKKLDEESEGAKRRADDLAVELKKAQDAQTQFLLMQQMQRENDLRRDLEERKIREMERAQQTALAASMPPPMPTILPPEPKSDGTAELVRALTESNARVFEVMLARTNQPAPVAPQQKDAAEWVLPLISQMQQQAMAQQQANQQMLVQIMQGNQQFMQALVTRESPEVKLLRDELREVRAAANAPKGDDIEEFAEKFQKLKVVGELMGGGGGAATTGLIDSLVANADTIGAGVAKIIAAAKPTPRLPMRAPTPMAGAPIQTQQALPPGQPQQQAAPPPKPEVAIAHLAAASEAALAGDQEQKVIDEVVSMVQSLMGLPHPFPTIGRKVLEALKQVKDHDDLFSVAKHLWVATGQEIDKKAARAIADVFYKWFPLVHQSLFGEMRYLDGQSEEMFAAIMAAGVPQPAEEPESDEESGEDGEDDGEESEDDGAIDTAAVDDNAKTIGG